MPENHETAQWVPAQKEELGRPKHGRAVQAEAHSRLRKSGYHQLHLVSCDFHEGVLTLSGYVSSFHLKQIAQTLIRGLDGIKEVDNCLEVVAPP